MIDREAIANHLYRRGAWTLDVCRKVAEEIVSLTSAGEGAVPVGWQLVPNEMTADMVLAAHRQIDWCRNNQNTHRPYHPTQTEYGTTSCGEDIRDAWRGALAAAPHPPRQDGAREGGLSQQFAETIDWIDQAGVVSDGQLETLHKACDRLNFLEASTPPAPDEAVEAELNLDDYHGAPSGIGPLAYTWQDKPHRLLYDLIKELRLLRARSRRDVGGGV